MYVQRQARQTVTGLTTLIQEDKQQAVTERPNIATDSNNYDLSTEPFNRQQTDLTADRLHFRRRGVYWKWHWNF
jgi:hypothetical protein